MHHSACFGEAYDWEAREGLEAGALLGIGGDAWNLAAWMAKACPAVGIMSFFPAGESAGALLLSEEVGRGATLSYLLPMLRDALKDQRFQRLWSDSYCFRVCRVISSHFPLVFVATVLADGRNHPRDGGARGGPRAPRSQGMMARIG